MRKNEDRVAQPQWAGFVRGIVPGAGEVSFERLHGGGSARGFYRVFGAGRECVLVVNPSPPGDHGVDENDTYVYVAGLLAEVIPGSAPEVYGFDRQAGLILVEDLGDCLLQEEVLSRGAESPWTLNIYRRLIELLSQMQLECAERFDPSRSFNLRYDGSFMYDYEGLYFAREFVEGLCRMETAALLPELGRLSREAHERCGMKLFLYRDFQSSNIMLQGDRIRLTDFQGARLGPPAYDLASLLYDPYVSLGTGMREALAAEFAELLARGSKEASQQFTDQYHWVAAHRLMQVLGAYAKLWRRDGKAQFSRYIAPALADLGQLLAGEEFDCYPVLRGIVEETDPEDLSSEQ